MSLTVRALMVDYRLFGPPLPRAEALPRSSFVRREFPPLNIRVSLLGGHWSLTGGHWSADLAAGYVRARAAVAVNS